MPATVSAERDESSRILDRAIGKAPMTVDVTALRHDEIVLIGQPVVGLDPHRVSTTDGTSVEVALIVVEAGSAALSEWAPCFSATIT
jgi:hypothetical protein